LSPTNATLTISVISPTTDYVINPYLNSTTVATANVVFQPDAKRTLVGITDGSSNTVMVGHGQINPTNYSTTAVTGTGYINTCFYGGTGTTALTQLSATAQVFQRDSSTGTVTTASNARGWGGPFPQGAMMAMGDATVRMFPYSMGGGAVAATGIGTPVTSLAAFLTPTGGETVTIPDT
jgi:Protein of unknown function (DUF1559)